MKIPIRNVYYLLCYAWQHLEESDLVDRSALEGMERIADLLGKVLAEGTFRLVRRGVDRGYREVRAEIAGVRGKLDVGAMATTAVRARGRTICTFETYTADVLHNRIVRSTLGVLLRVENLDPDVRRDVGLAYEKLDGIEIVPLRRDLFRRVQLDRNQRVYRFLLAVCELVLDSLLVEQRTGHVRFRDIRRNMKRMWALFERFALEFFTRELAGYQVSGQRHLGWAGLSDASAYARFVPKMKPDVVLESPQRRIVLDTKFYRRPLSSRSGSPKVRSGNLYQIVAYLANRQAARPHGPRHEGILLYAAVERRLRIEVELQGFTVQARTVDLSRPWNEIRDEMLEPFA